MKKINKILKNYLLVGSLYLLGVGLVHLSDIRLINASNWPIGPLIFSRFMEQLFGLCACLVAFFGLEVQKDLSKYKNILNIVAIWSFIYACYLIYSTLTINFPSLFRDTPSAYFWLPFYNLNLVFEASSMFILSLLIFLWYKFNKHETSS